MHGREDMVPGKGDMVAENGYYWWHCIDTQEAKKEQETELGSDLDKPVRVHLLNVHSFLKQHHKLGTKAFR